MEAIAPGLSDVWEDKWKNARRQQQGPPKLKWVSYGNPKWE
jgi:hypothetical protein